MTIHDMLANLEITEDRELEFKAARGGLPRSLWESYSAMANTDGGLIILGVKESGGGYVVEGLPNVRKLVQEFWNLASNRQKVSINLLSNDDVSILQVSGRSVVVLRIPRATRWQRPVFLGSTPFGGTYRRHAEGDYQCTDDEVRRMFADQSDQPADSAILEHFSMDDLDPVSLSQYRNRFASRLQGTHGSAKMIRCCWRSWVGGE